MQRCISLITLLSFLHLQGNSCCTQHQNVLIQIATDSFTAFSLDHDTDSDHHHHDCPCQSNSKTGSESKNIPHLCVGNCIVYHHAQQTNNLSSKLKYWIRCSCSVDVCSVVSFPLVSAISPCQNIVSTLPLRAQLNVYQV